MQSITGIIKKLSLSAAVLILGSFTMLGAAGVAAADCDPTPPPDSSYGNGVHHPTGSAAVTYVYDCNTATWTNAHYTYYPASNTYVANYAPNYTYSCDTGIWTMDEWSYSPADSAYHLGRSVTADPGIATNCPVAPPADPGASQGSGGTGSITNTGPGSSNSTGVNATDNSTSTNTTGVGMHNILISNADTGNAFVINNTTGGSAGSGNATSIASVANLLQSTTNAFGPNTTMFTANINGDVTGDFMFDPSAILATGPGSTNSANNNLTVNSNDTNNTSASITNDVDVGAGTGNATVAGNTTGGNATTGNAQAVVNLMNLINSTVASGQSFIGTININGDLNGDILLPQGVIDALLASTGPGSNNVANTSVTDNSTTTNTTTQAIQNNLTSSAVTGSANVSGNTNGGSATSGTASSGVTILNLTGSNTIGKNSLLVFVNVLGKWVGMIMNAPTGSTAAQLGGGITQSGPGSNNTLASNILGNSTTTNTVTQGITNNVNVHARSGDASVTGNTTGGNATSGNASTAVNILNLEGSNISLSDWFGILFINVFGIWNGSFGVNTSAGDPASNPSNNPVQAANQEAMATQFKQFATFVAASGGPATSSVAHTADAVLGTATSVAKKISATNTTKLPTPDNAHASFLLPIIGVLLAGTILLVSERDRIIARIKKH
jgi:hypothetical protein